MELTDDIEKASVDRNHIPEFCKRLDAIGLAIVTNDSGDRLFKGLPKSNNKNHIDQAIAEFLEGVGVLFERFPEYRSSFVLFLTRLGTVGDHHFGKACMLELKRCVLTGPEVGVLVFQTLNTTLGKELKSIDVTGDKALIIFESLSAFCPQDPISRNFGHWPELFSNMSAIICEAFCTLANETVGLKHKVWRSFLSILVVILSDEHQARLAIDTYNMLPIVWRLVDAVPDALFESVKNEYCLLVKCLILLCIDEGVAEFLYKNNVHVACVTRIRTRLGTAGKNEGGPQTPHEFIICGHFIRLLSTMAERKPIYLEEIYLDLDCLHLFLRCVKDLYPERSVGAHRPDPILIGESLHALTIACHDETFRDKKINHISEQLNYVVPMLQIFSGQLFEPIWRTSHERYGIFGGTFLLQI